MSLKDVTNSIKAALAELDDPSKVDGEDRKALLAAYDQLKDALETPMEKLLKILFSPYEAVTTRIAIDSGIFDAFAAAPNGELGIPELIEKTKAEEAFLKRWLPMLVAYRFLEQTGETRFKALPRAALFVSASPLPSSIVHFGLHHESLVKMPAYFEQNGYKNPADAWDGPFQFALGTKEHYFDWLAKHPKDQEAFNITMGVSRQDSGQEWFEIYPVLEKLSGAAGVSKDDVLLVDIGGGLGHDLLAFKTKYPELPGRLIVEELPAVVNDVKEKPGGIEFLEHDFFTPQPIQGARAYYMRTVLHDWPDKQAKKILEGIRAAMGPSSLLLINEGIVPESNVPSTTAHLDITMMLSLSALERTRQHWTELLRSAGFRVTGFYESKSNIVGSSALIEAVTE